MVRLQSRALNVVTKCDKSGANLASFKDFARHLHYVLAKFASYHHIRELFGKICAQTDCASRNLVDLLVTS